MRLDVYVNGHLSGLLEQPSPQQYRFTYRKDGLPISLTMPVRTQPYIAPYLFPIFQVSLPEGALRATIERDILKRVDASGDMAVLSLVGAHLVGAVTVVPEGASPEIPRNPLDVSGLLRHGNTEAFVTHILQQYAHQSGVSGSYPKILSTQESAVGNPIHAGALIFSQGIAKFSDSHHPALAFNEHQTLQSARGGAIDTVETHISDDGEILWVHRFDRPDASNHQVAFEDMAALMGLPASARFSGSVERIIKTIKTVCRDDPLRTRSLEQFFRQYALAMIVRNGDAHLKNFGILYDPETGVQSARLAPCYDMVTMTAYAPMNQSGDDTQDIPALMWRNTKRWFTLRDFQQLGSLCGIARVSEETDTIAASVHAVARSLADTLPQTPPRTVAVGIKMLRLWRAGLEHSGLLCASDFPSEACGQKTSPHTTGNPLSTVAVHHKKSGSTPSP